MSIESTLRAHMEIAAVDKSENQLATELGIDVATLHRWRTNERSIGLKTAERLAEYFGLELKPARAAKRGR